LHTLEMTYVQIAQDTIRQYEHDAAVNNLEFDRHGEAIAVETFASSIEIAAKAFWDNPRSSPVIPNWNRVTSARPDFLDRLREAVELDNKS